MDLDSLMCGECAKFGGAGRRSKKTKIWEEDLNTQQGKKKSRENYLDGLSSAMAIKRNTGQADQD